MRVVRTVVEPDVAHVLLKAKICEHLSVPPPLIRDFRVHPRDSTATVAPKTGILISDSACFYLEGVI